LPIGFFSRIGFDFVVSSDYGPLFLGNNSPIQVELSEISGKRKAVKGWLTTELMTISLRAAVSVITAISNGCQTQLISVDFPDFVQTIDSKS